ncbi:MAG TPA: tetratricopeptide repeat protein [Terriglobia bacterium]
MTTALVLCIAAALPPAARPQDPAGSTSPVTAALARQFQSAAAHFDAGEYAAAEQELKPLLKQAPDNSQVNELAGLVYAAQGRNHEASAYLEKAVRLDPKSGAAHTNLAADLARLGDNTRAEAEFRKALDIEPGSFEANHDLAEFYVRLSKFQAAIPYFEKARTIDSSSFENGYDLALAELRTGKLDDARQEIQALLQQHDAAELHSLLADVEERAGNYLASAHEYELAAHMDPSEDNLFAWGCELLLHATYEPAAQVFSAGRARYPRSVPMALGMGIALYGHGTYDKAVEAFLNATDLDPSDIRPYQFLAKVYDVSPGQADAVTERMRRFVQIAPGSAQANYDYAMTLWKARREASEGAPPDQVQPLLERAIALDPKFADAYLQLGILSAGQRQYQKAVERYQQAVKFEPDLAEAHYRLGQALGRLGEAQAAEQELNIYQRLHEKQMLDTEEKRKEIREFVLTLQGSANSTASAGAPK